MTEWNPDQLVNDLLADEAIFGNQRPDLPASQPISEVQRLINAQLFWNDLGIDPYAARFDTPGGCGNRCEP